MTERLARYAALHPWRIVGAWLIAVILAIGAAGMLFSELDPEGSLTSNPESIRGEQVKEEHFSTDEEHSEIVVLRSDTVTVDDDQFDATIDALLVGLSDSGVVASAGDPRSDPQMISSGGDAVMVPVRLTEEGEDDVDPLVEAVASVDSEPFEAGVTGEFVANADFGEIAARDLQEGELQFGLPAALVILLLVFGAVVAALLPIALAIFAILVAVGLTAALSQGFLLSTFILNMIVVMGLALGIDYALFILSRFREERSKGLAKTDALVTAGATASRAVLFSGSAFVLAMIGLLAVPDTVLRSLAAGAILVAVIAVIAALTLLPAVVSLLGDRVNSLRIPVIGRRATEGGGREGAFWGRVVHLVLRKPGVSLVASVVVLVVMAAPLVTMQLGQIGLDTLPDDVGAKRGLDLIDRSFEAIGIDPAEVVVEGEVNSPAFDSAVAALGDSVADDPGFGGRPGVQLDADGTAALITVPITADPFSDRATGAVERLRETYVPTAFGGFEADPLVTGTSAFVLDYVDLVWLWLPLVIGLVLALTFVLMTVAFRSVVIAGTTLVLNLLSVAAAYGILVAVFQHGIGAGLFGFQEVEYIAPWIPLFMFAVLFGLSMDYQVFILSRIREHYRKTGSTEESIAHGIGSTARLVTGAALIIVAVFSGFATGDLVMFQQMGFGVAVALVIDATLVRSVLVPAAMGLLGDRNWYLPRRLEWIPHLEIEGERPDAAVGPHKVTARTEG